MDKTLNVLSIDWDYFINAKMRTRMLSFPRANENMSARGQIRAWSMMYKMKNTITDISSDYDAVKCIVDCIKSSSSIKKCLVSESHKDAYGFIKTELEAGDFNKINLINIDYHHDIYNDSKLLDCGTWLRRLMEICPSESDFTWIARKDSDETEYPEDMVINGITLKRVHELDIVDKFDCDIVMICRSDMWSPPHLDKNFALMVDAIKPFIEDFRIKAEVETPRKIEETLITTAISPILNDIPELQFRFEEDYGLIPSKPILMASKRSILLGVKNMYSYSEDSLKMVHASNISEICTSDEQTIFEIEMVYDDESEFKTLYFAEMPNIDDEVLIFPKYVIPAKYHKLIERMRNSSDKFKI